MSSLDIYGQVGANKPLVVSGIKTFVNGDEGLFIRFEGIIGSPIVCGISVRKDDFASKFKFYVLVPFCLFIFYSISYTN